MTDIDLVNPERSEEAASIVSPVSTEQVVYELSCLSKLEYDKVRRDKAKELGVQVKNLDLEVDALRKKNDSKDIHSLPEIEPWDEEVDPEDLLNQLEDAITRFIVLDKEAAHAATLWIAFTWFIDVVNVAPLAIVNAPERACGKSQLLDLMGRLACKPLVVSNLSPAFVFRAIEAWKPTILIDEADTFVRENDEFKGLVNAGHTRSAAHVGRVVGDNHTPQLFSVWGAKALAGIALEKHLPDATMSRAIVINLRRKLPSESVSRLRHAESNLFEVIQRKLARFSDDYSAQVRDARPYLPESLGDRDQDNWEPLLSVASCAGDRWLHKATNAAIKLSKSGEKPISTGNQLLADIYDIFQTKGWLKISSADLVAELIKDDEKPWASYNFKSSNKSITPAQVAKLLRVYGICSKTVRLNSYDTAKGYEANQFDDAFARYLFDTPADLPSQGNKSPDPLLHKALDVTPELACAVTRGNTSHSVTPVNVTSNREVTANHAPSLDCDVVTAKQGVSSQHKESVMRV